MDLGSSLLDKTPLPGGCCTVTKSASPVLFHSPGSLVFLPFRPAETLSRSNSFAGGGRRRFPLLVCATAQQSSAGISEATQSHERSVQLLQFLLCSIPFCPSTPRLGLSICARFSSGKRCSNGEASPNRFTPSPSTTGNADFLGGITFRIAELD